MAKGAPHDLLSLFSTEALSHIGFYETWRRDIHVQQIFGADEQDLARRQSDQEGFGPSVWGPNSSRRPLRKFCEKF